MKKFLVNRSHRFDDRDVRREVKVEDASLEGAALAEESSKLLQNG